MRRGPLLPVVIACSAILLASGCGSSGSSGTTGSSGSGGTTGSSGSSGTTSSKTAKTGATSSLKTDTAPKYAVPATSAPVQSGTVQIAYRNIAIDPDTVKVKVGSTIKWTNYDPVEHKVTSESGPQKFASTLSGEGHSFEVKLTKPGVIHYLCTIHPASMNGTIEVVK
jgi:plastocyanin